MNASQSSHASLAPRAPTSYTERLDKTLQKLQNRVKEQEALLADLQASTGSVDTEPSQDLSEHLRQLRAIKDAYETATPQEPYFPSSESPLPALLALRGMDRCIKETKSCITVAEFDLQEQQKRLETEQSNCKDDKLVQLRLEERIFRLQEELETRMQKTPGQIGKEMVRDMKAKKKHYDTETGKLVKAFNEFIDEHLSAMLAAEELGGPIVGGVLDVDDEMLGVGFSAQGKPRKLRANLNEDKRQRRIDQIWGSKSSEDGARKPWSEQEAAATEMRELTEQLLNSLVEAGGNGPGTYVELERESAAARFLVRAKVGKLHPKDARKLRLIDFGGEFED